MNLALQVRLVEMAEKEGMDEMDATGVMVQMVDRDQRDELAATATEDSQGQYKFSL